MPPTSILSTAPQALRDELDHRLVASGYGRLEEQAAWLRENGVQIGKSAVGEYSLELREKMERRQERALIRIQIHKALGGLSDTDKTALIESGEMAAYDAYLDAWDELAGMTREERIKALPGMIRAGADLSRSAVGTAKWKGQVEEEIRQKAMAEASAKAESVAKAEGVTPATIQKIRQALGVGV